MPSFKTHSIHGELILPGIDMRTDIDVEDMKSFCIGPDAMVLTDTRTFYYQHANKTRRFFCTLINYIKKNRLQDNSEVMAFLYGQIDHFVLDLTMHPLIYYMTENIKKRHVMPPHALIENWMDDYAVQKTEKTDTFYYHKWFIKNKELIKLINEVYKRVYGVRGEGIKYSFGMFALEMFDMLAKRNTIGITPFVISVGNLGDFTYKNNYRRVLQFLNLERDTWYNPETGEACRDSFNDLWNKSVGDSLETIQDVNLCIYQDKPLTNKLILEDRSFDTGLPCRKGQSLRFVKKY